MQQVSRYAAALIAGVTINYACAQAQTEAVFLVKNGKPAATIVVADEPIRIPLSKGDVPLTQRYAAEELQAFIEKATGARLPIAPAAQAPAEGTLVLVGRSAASAAFELDTPTRPEGLRVATFPRGLAILGEVAPKETNRLDYELDRGTLFGVYEFLERVVGYRFYFADKQDPDLGTVTPSVKDVSVPARYTLELAPDFPHRVAAFATWEDPIGCMRCTREGAADAFYTNHSDPRWGQVYRQNHPEYFALQKDGTRHPGNLCHSEPAVVAQRIADVEEFDKSGKWSVGWVRPSPKYVAFVPRDVAAGCHCQCPDCLRRARPLEARGRYGTASNIIFHHGAEVARAIARRWPGRRLAMAAFRDYTIVPDFDLPENLDVMVNQMYTSTMGKEAYWHERNMQIMREWFAKVGCRRERLLVWNYLCWPAFWTNMPLIFPHYLQKWLRDTYEISSGEFVNPPGANRQLDHFMCWLWHRLMWDRNADVDALLRDYGEKFYGPAAGPMKALYEIAIDRYENVKWSRPLDESYIPAELMYLESFPSAPVAQMKQRFADALAACPPDEGNIYRRRVAWMKQGWDVFFREAEHAHKWLQNPPAAAVPAVVRVDDAAWTKAPRLKLSQDNYGYDPDLLTTVAVLRDTHSVYVRCVSPQTAPLWDGDTVTLRFKAAGKDEVTAVVNFDGKLNGTEGNAEVLASEVAGSNWTVTVKLAAEALSLPAGGGTLSANFERFRRDDPGNRDRGREYTWMPKMRPPWVWPMRYGTLTFADVE